MTAEHGARNLIQQSFEDRVLGCVDRGMGALGESVRQAIQWHVEHVRGLKRGDIPSKPREFADALRDIFGPGAALIEKAIVRELKTEFNIKQSVERFDDTVARITSAEKT